jgi:hypothetical protein
MAEIVKSTYNRENYLKNKEKIAERCKKYRLGNKEKIVEINRRYFLENKEKISEKCKEYRLENKEKISERNKKYYLKNKKGGGDYLLYGRKSRELLLDGYVKSILKKMGFLQEQITPELIELKRINIKTERLCRQLKN